MKYALLQLTHEQITCFNWFLFMHIFTLTIIAHLNYCLQYV